MDRSYLRYRRLLGCLGLGVAALASAAPASAQQVIAGKGAVTIDLGVLNQLGQPVSQGYAPSGQTYPGYSQPLYGQPTYGQAYAPGYMQTYGGLQFPPPRYPASTLLVQPPAGAAPYVPQAASAPAMTAPALTPPASSTSTTMAPASSAATASTGATGTPPPAPTPTPAAVPMTTTDTSGAATTASGSTSGTAASTGTYEATTSTGAATTTVPAATPLATTDTASTSGSTSTPAPSATTTTDTAATAATSGAPAAPAAPGTDTATTAGTAATGTAATGTAATGTAATGTASTDTGASGTTQTASIPPAATTEGQIRITFPADSADIPDSVKAQLDALAQKMAGDDNMRIQLLAYASGTSEQASRARRMSLSRALAVRSYLIKQGVRSTRMDVRALGNNVEGSPQDRVDIIPKTQ